MKDNLKTPCLEGVFCTGGGLICLKNSVCESYCSPWRECVLFSPLAAFTIFFIFVFGFQQFYYDVPCCSLHVFVHHGISKVFCICGLSLLSVLENSLQIFPLPISFLSSGTTVIYLYMIIYNVPYTSYLLFLYFAFFFSLWFSLGISHWPRFWSIIFLFSYVQCAPNSLIEFSLYCIFQF